MPLYSFFLKISIKTRKDQMTVCNWIKKDSLGSYCDGNYKKILDHDWFM